MLMVKAYGYVSYLLYELREAALLIQGYSSAIIRRSKNLDTAAAWPAILQKRR